MNIITSKGRVIGVKAIYPIEEVEYKLNGEVQRAYAHTSSISYANGLMFWLDTPTNWLNQYFIVGNLENNLLHEIMNTVSNGKVFDFTKLKYQSAKEAKDISLSSSLPWSSEYTIMPFGSIAQLQYIPEPTYPISVAAGGMQSLEFFDDTEGDDCEEDGFYAEE